MLLQFDWLFLSLLELNGQFCADSVDVDRGSDDQIGYDRLAIIPRLNFTCNGRVIKIRARVRLDNERSEYPSFQVWRLASAGSTVYNKIGQIQLQSSGQMNINNDGFGVATIILTGNSTIEVQSGDVVGYYHPPDARYRVRTIQNDGYILYQFTGSHKSADLKNSSNIDNEQQPLIQFNIGKYISN